MQIDDLERHLRAALDERASEFGLTAPVSTTYRPHGGGFVNAGFTVTDGTVTLHAKCVEGPNRLRSWRAFGDVLAERYRAPRVHGFLEAGGWNVMLCEHIDGAPPPDADAAVATEVTAVIDELHHDGALAERLPPAPLRASFIHYFAEICESDLAENPVLPPFVDAETAAWMPQAVAEMRATIEGSAAFDGPATVAVHGDLWEGNLIVTPQGTRIIDWDSLGLGDPAIDLVLLLFPAVDHGGLDARDLLGDRDPAFWERFTLGLRGCLLIGIIDVLADWNEAARAPDDIRDDHRARCEEVHRWALDRYRTLYR